MSNLSNINKFVVYIYIYDVSTILFTLIIREMELLKLGEIKQRNTHKFVQRPFIVSV